MKKTGNYTYVLSSPVGILSCASAVGKKEGQGPLGKQFDFVADDDLLGQKAWESAESQFQKKALELAIKKDSSSNQDIDAVFAGDLLGQSSASTFGLREFGIPHVGMYGACSTMALTLINAAVWVENGADKVAAVTSSHFCSAEREFRFPLDYGSIRTPSSQWTVTGSGAILLSKNGAPKIEGFTLGKIVDLNQTDANNMGAAMAPAAADTITRYFNDTGKSPDCFDAIVTGDLGVIGSDLLIQILLTNGIDIRKVHKDCGKMMFDIEKQDVHAGASGCGCSASILCAYFIPRLKEGSLKNILFCATGALLSTISTNQGESIPGICHLLHLSH